MCLKKNEKSTSSYLTQLFLNKKIALRTNEIKIYRAINQSYRIIQTFYVRRTLPKYLRTFLQKHLVLMMVITDQSYYSLCHLLAKTFILTVYIYIKIRGGCFCNQFNFFTWHIVFATLFFHSIIKHQQWIPQMRW